MPEKKSAPAGMVCCVVRTPCGPHKPGATIYMHPLDALEYHLLGIIEADKSFLSDLQALEAAKRKEK